MPEHGIFYTAVSPRVCDSSSCFIYRFWSLYYDIVYSGTWLRAFESKPLIQFYNEELHIRLGAMP
jgi:hypothetical protein